MPLPPKEEAKRLFLLKLKFNLYAKTNLASSFGGSVGNADDRGLYVILSVSEISHNQSEKYILCGNSPSREIASSFHFLAMTNKKYVLLSVSEISHD